MGQPVRYLSDFSFYEWQSRRLVSLQEHAGAFGASGVIAPCFKDDGDDGFEDRELSFNKTGTSPSLTDADFQRVRLDKPKVWLDPDHGDSFVLSLAW